MKILALNGSPRGANGSTDVILTNFLKGCKNAGADVETVYLKDKNIKHCSGCFHCWSKTPGKCIYKDDMAELLIKVSKSDIIVYATPLYHFGVTGIMKDFIDRTLPLSYGIIDANGMPSTSSDIKENTSLKTVLISVCGLPDTHNFSGLVETFKLLTDDNLSGTILCAQGSALKNIYENESIKSIYAPFLSALKTAGEDIVNEGHIKPETQKILNKSGNPPIIFKHK